VTKITGCIFVTHSIQFFMLGKLLHMHILQNSCQ